MLTKEQYDSLVTDLNTQAAKKIKDEVDALDVKLNAKREEAIKGYVTAEELTKFKNDELGKLNDLVKNLEVLSEASKAQGSKITAILEGEGGKKIKSINEVLEVNLPKMKEIYKAGQGFMTITGAELKAAGVTSIGGSIDPASPYAPGIGGTTLELFDIIHNANFIINRVDMGSTNQFKLAWINETAVEGLPVNTNIPESGLKTLVQHKFSVEISTAKKAGAYSILTEEFDTDIPGLSSEVRGLLQADVIRNFDDALQAGILAAATEFNLTGLYDEIFNASLWDAAYALITQVGFNNFTPNTLAVDWITNGKMQMAKNMNGTYLLPPFKDEIMSLLVRANKITTNTAIAGDLKQYRVRMYKDYELRIGWINDQFIHNEFCILGELRYHDFISDNRKKAIVKGDLNAIKALINGTPGS